MRENWEKIAPAFVSCREAVYHYSYVIEQVAQTFDFARGKKFETPAPYGIYSY